MVMSALLGICLCLVAAWSSSKRPEVELADCREILLEAPKFQVGTRLVHAKDQD